MGIDTGTTMSDTMTVQVEPGVPEEQEETWAQVADANVEANVRDPLSQVTVDKESTGCIVILTQL